MKRQFNVQDWRGRLMLQMSVSLANFQFGEVNIGECLNLRCSTGKNIVMLTTLLTFMLSISSYFPLESKIEFSSIKFINEE